ncbi:MAG: hypothetical protein ABL925_11030 [Methylococcales bacterium]
MKISARYIRKLIYKSPLLALAALMLAIPLTSLWAAPAPITATAKFDKN